MKGHERQSVAVVREHSGHAMKDHHAFRISNALVPSDAYRTARAEPLECVSSANDCHSHSLRRSPPSSRFANENSRDGEGVSLYFGKRIDEIGNAIEK